MDLGELGNGLLWLAALLVGLPLGMLLVESLGALRPLRPQLVYEARPRTAVLIPAHNEAAALPHLLEPLAAQLLPGDRLIVIADNCDDGTAATALHYGAAVWRRDDAERRGKGYAVEFGIAQLAAEPPEVVVLIDADCRAPAGAIDRLASLAHASRCAVQASYLMAAPMKATPGDRVSQMAVTVKNHVRPWGMMQLGLPCLLTGSGMAFPWGLIEKLDWRGGNLVEDMRLSVDLWLADRGPLFCPDVQITADLPAQPAAARSQRTRWEHGHLQTLLTQTPRLLRAGVRRPVLLAAALDLAIPPLSLLAMFWSGALLLALIGGASGGSWAPAAFLTLLGGAAFAALLAAYAHHAADAAEVRSLAALPGYVARKLSIYLKFLWRPQRTWIRTPRDAGSPALEPEAQLARQSPTYP